MKKFVLLFIFASFCLALSACGRTKNLLFWNKKSDISPAFVDEKNPLAVPPEYDVRPVAAVEDEE